MKSLQIIDRNGILIKFKKNKGNRIDISFEDTYRANKETVNIDDNDAKSIREWFDKAFKPDDLEQ